MPADINQVEKEVVKESTVKVYKISSATLEATA